MKNTHLSLASNFQKKMTGYYNLNQTKHLHNKHQLLHLAYQGGKQCYLGYVCLLDQKFCGELILPKERRQQAKVQCQKAKPKQHP